MKKKLIAAGVVLAIAAVLFLAGYIVILKALNPQKIRQIIYDYASKNSVELTIGEISYRISLSGIFFNADGIDFTHERAEGRIERLSFQLDIFKLLKKEIYINKMILKDPDIRLRKTSQRTDSTSAGKFDLSITSNLRIENGKIEYDTLCAESLYSDILMSADSSINLLGNASFRIIAGIPNELRSVRASFSVEIGDSVLIKHFSIKNSKAAISGEGSFKDSLLTAKADIQTGEPEYFKNLLFKNDSVSINGNARITVSGQYNLSKSVRENMLSLERIQSDLTGLNAFIYGKSISLLENSYLEKNGDMLSLYLEADAESSKFSFTLNLSLAGLWEGIYEGNAAAKNFDLKLAERFLSMGKMNASGPVSASYRFRLEKDSIASGYVYMLKKGDAYINFSQIDASYDTFKAVLKKADLKSSNGRLSGICGIIFKGSEFNLRFGGDIAENLQAVFSGTGEADSLKKGMKGMFEASGTVYYVPEKRRWSASADASARGIVLQGINDTLSLNLLGIELDNGKKASVRNAVLKGKFIQGSSEKMSARIEEGLLSLESSFNIDYVNVDSLLKKEKTEEGQKAEPKPIDIPKGLKVNAEGTVKKLIMKDETANDVKMKFRIDNREFHVERMDAKMLNGKINGTADYYAAKDGYAECSATAAGLVAGELIKRQKLLPFDAGTVVDSDVKIRFNQHKIKETIEGKVNVKSKGGWMLLPGVLAKVSEVLHLELNDTFYFEDMNGEFDIKDKHVYFSDFYMEKNGHSLLYSGDVDFEKNMNIEGLYLIDMKTADTGILEKMLKSAFYESDTIEVKFHLKGNYKEPKVDIYYSSIGEFLKKRTQENVDEMIEKLNELFKF